jgi:hypothetical protein
MHSGSDLAIRTTKLLASEEALSGQHQQSCGDYQQNDQDKAII